VFQGAWPRFNQSKQSVSNISSLACLLQHQDSKDTPPVLLGLSTKYGRSTWKSQAMRSTCKIRLLRWNLSLPTFNSLLRLTGADEEAFGGLILKFRICAEFRESHGHQEA
jgi:hypothetical protein